MGRMRYSALGLAGLAVAIGSGAAIAGRGASFFDPQRHIFSAFIGSLADIPQLMGARGYLQISAQASLAPIPTDAIVCRPEGNAPDIVLFLNESVMPPGVYPEINFPPESKPFFTSFDGRIHNMRVETFGGGTWLTDFSALTGLSTSMFGNMRNFAAQLTTGRLRHTLPQYLKACGYDTTMIYPSLAEFAGSAKFYRSIGFDRVIDRAVHKAPDERQRDAFYYNEVRKVLDAAPRTGGEGGARRPQFIVASSMSPHSPWNFRFAPEAVKPGETTRWNADPEIDEYLWRIVLARRDRDAFRADLKQSLSGPSVPVRQLRRPPARADAPAARQRRRHRRHGVGLAARSHLARVPDLLRHRGPGLHAAHRHARRGDSRSASSCDADRGRRRPAARCGVRPAPAPAGAVRRPLHDLRGSRRGHGVPALAR